jgi:uncharacterized membrane protein
MSAKLKESLKYIKKYPAAILLIPLAYSVLEYGLMLNLRPSDLATSSISSILSEGFSQIGIYFIVFEILRIVFTAGYLSIILDVVNGKDINVSLFRTYMTRSRLKRVLLVELVVIPVFIAGMMLFILPGVFWFVITIFSYYIVLDRKDEGILNSISLSMTLTKGYRWGLFAVLLAYSLIYFISSVLPLVSVLIDAFITSVFSILIGLYYKESSTNNAV